MLLRKMIFAAIAALMCVCVAGDAMAQRGGGGGFFGGGGDSMLQYLNSEQVQTEIDLLDDQKEQIKEVQEEARDIMREAFSGMREKFQDLSREERNDMMADIREQIQEDMKDSEKKVGEILVPHQLDRLKQLMLQAKMRRGTADALVDALDLTEDEAEALKEKEEEVKKELEEDIKKLREKALDKTLSVLPADKRAKAKEMIGEAFELQQRGRGGNRGGGARGGNRGGGGGGGRGGRGGGGDRGGRGDF